MNHYLKTYKVEIRTLAPLFIGEGKTIGKKEYLYSRGMVLVPDVEKMYRAICKKRLERQFTDFLMNSSDRRDLGAWMRDCGVTPAEYTPWIRYRLEGGDHLTTGKRPMEILTFYKDAYGFPYVPGSSLKGMLRTILLAYEVMNGSGTGLKQSLPEEVKDPGKGRNRNTFLLLEQKNLETEVFHTLNRTDARGKPVRQTDAVNDCLSGLIVSDSHPLDLKVLTLCQKLDVRLDGTCNGINILRECVKPDTRITFSLTIDETLCPYSIEEIRKAVDTFSDMYYELFLSRFPHTDRPSSDTVWLGGGAGYFTKTVVYPLLGRDQGLRTTVDIYRKTMSEKIFNEHGHGKDVRLGISPHILKTTQYQGKSYEMGKCRLMVTE